MPTFCGVDTAHEICSNGSDAARRRRQRLSAVPNDSDDDIPDAVRKAACDLPRPDGAPALQPPDVAHAIAAARAGLDRDLAAARAARAAADVYTVERIVAQRRGKKFGGVEYLVKWEGYASRKNSWEPSAHFLGGGARSMVDAFERKRGFPARGAVRRHVHSQ